MVKKVKVKDKWKGKDWFKILAPKYFNLKEIGETLALDASSIMGRVVETSLMSLGGDPGRYYFKLSFKVYELDGSKAMTKFHGHECTRDFISRIVQVRTTRIDTNDVLNLKDGKIRLKTIAVTNREVNIKVAEAIRKFISEKIKKLEEKTIEEFVKDMTVGRIQSDIRKEASKIYPVRFFEFRKSEVLG